MKLYTDSPEGMTVVPNAFIDRFMPHANGEFVKVYLYLLRCADTGQELSLASIADVFDHTEKDVRRALAYWEKQKLLRLKLSPKDEITSATFLTPPAEEPAGAAAEADDARRADGARRTAAARKADDTSGVSNTLSRTQIRERSGQEDIRQLFFIAEQYFGRPLTTSEQSDLIYYYDELHFSTDLIDYLLDYCITKGSKSRQYIRAVALGWAQAGITTVQEAQKDTNLYNKNYYTVLNAFGIKSRGPAAPEQEIMSRWFNERGFPIELVLEACNRTIRQTHKPSFEYADSILEHWRENHVVSLADVEQLDAQRKQEHGQEQKKKTGRRTDDFPQRTYDFTQFEKKLLRQQTGTNSGE